MLLDVAYFNLSSYRFFSKWHLHIRTFWYTIYDALVSSILEAISIICFWTKWLNVMDKGLIKYRENYLCIYMWKNSGTNRFCFLMLSFRMPWNTLSTSRSVYIIKHFRKLLTVIVYNPSILEMLSTYESLFLYTILNLS